MAMLWIAYAVEAFVFHKHILFKVENIFCFISNCLYSFPLKWSLYNMLNL